MRHAPKRHRHIRHTDLPGHFHVLSSRNMNMQTFRLTYSLNSIQFRTPKHIFQLEILRDNPKCNKLCMYSWKTLPSFIVVHRVSVSTLRCYVLRIVQRSRLRRTKPGAMMYVHIE